MYLAWARITCHVYLVPCLELWQDDIEKNEKTCILIPVIRAGGRKFQKLFAYRKISGVDVRVMIVCCDVIN